ncbi:MAG: hypothetical protein QW240_04450 [Candidatus Caldarchaeum sp.]
MEAGKVSVRIRHGQTEVEFTGDRESVWAAVNKYFAETLGPVDILSRLMGNVSVTDLMKKLEGRVVVNPDGIDVLGEGDLKRRIVLCLAAAWAGKRLGIYPEDGLTPKKIASVLRVDERIVRARLSELWRDGFVDKDGEGVYFFKPSKSINLLES